jgi:centriolar protein POC1
MLRCKPCTAVITGLTVAAVLATTIPIISASAAPHPALLVAAQPVAVAPSLVVKQQFQAHDTAVTRIHYSPDGKTLVTSLADGVAKLWTATGQELTEFSGQKSPMFNANFSPNSQQLITTGYDGTIRIWSTTGKLIQEIQAHQAAVADAVFSPNGRLIITSSDDGQTKIWMRTGREMSKIIRPGTARNLAYSSDGKLIASTSDSGSVQLLTPDGTAIATIDSPQGRMNNVTFSPNHQQLLTAGVDGTARLWTVTGKPVQTLKVVETGWVNSAQFSPLGQYIATASDDGTVRLWNRSGTLLNSLKLTEGRITSISFSPDGKRLAASGANGQVWIANITP